MDEGLVPEEKKKRKDAVNRQAEALRKQKQVQQSELAEVDDEKARKIFLAKSPKSGRRSLINPQGNLKTTLG